ncbi:hypothetical protein [Vibrio coralliilyticus]|uniref:hypothetical protein n=1 Tax=Vibrio coralliilyticus TaxID=190893 RepID=UPI001E4E0AE3|nr:hypothetical protein [Vibrio coralliilyticus]MCC2525570.1 hypothetical protein [Vibrio coralliilyticus]
MILRFICIILSVFFSTQALSNPVKEISISLSGSETGEIFANGKNQIEIFIKVALNEGEEVDWITLIREQNEQDIQNLGWLYRSPMGETDEYYLNNGKYDLSNEFLKTTQSNPFSLNRAYSINQKFNVPNTYNHYQTMYLSSNVIQTLDICAKVLLKSGHIETSCRGKEPSVTVRAIAPNIIPSNQFSSTSTIHEDDIVEIDEETHFTNVKALLGPPQLEGKIHSIYINDLQDNSQLYIYDGNEIKFSGEKTAVYWRDNKTYHLSIPSSRYFSYLTLSKKITIDFNSVSSEMNNLISGSSHILNIISIPYDIQGSRNDTIWVENGGVYSTNYRGCFFPPEREYVYSNKENCSVDILENILEHIKNRSSELIIIDYWGTEHRIKIDNVI